MFKKLVKSFLLVFGVLCFTSNQVFSAKLEFQIEISQVIYDGDTLHFNKKVKLQGEMKNHTQRLAIATLDDGTVLHLEMWVTLEKDGKTYVIDENGVATEKVN